MRSVTALLAFAASALAFQVTQPTNATGWSTAGSNVVAWTSVSTDAANFTIVLVNQNVYPPTTQILAALVDSSLGNTTVNPPSGGWKSGAGFQVNLVKDDTDLNTILAQSPQFTIAAASTTQSATTSAIATSGTGTLTIATTTTSGNSGASDLNPSASQTDTSPTTNSAAGMGVSTGLFAGIALLGAFLA